MTRTLVNAINSLYKQVSSRFWSKDSSRVITGFLKLSAIAVVVECCQVGADVFPTAVIVYTPC